MEAIRKVQKVENGEVNLQLPKQFWGQEVEIIVLAVQRGKGDARKRGREEKGTRGKGDARKRGRIYLFCSLSGVEAKDGFDSAQPAATLITSHNLTILNVQ